ncbi:MAG: chemotaxis protein CheD [Deltaproteobacteria bacterium]
MDKVVVRIADYRIAEAPATLVTYGLGSCVAVALYDTETRMGGLCHIMLPSSSKARDSGNPKKFADICISEMLEDMENRGCNVDRMVAKIAGGARMFDLPNKEKSSSIGERNRDAVLIELAKRRIPLIAEDTGENYGRTMEFHLGNGDMLVISLRGGTKVYRDEAL